MKIKCNRIEAPLYNNHPNVLPLAQEIVDSAEARGATVEDLLSAMKKVRSDIELNQSRLTLSQL